LRPKGKINKQHPAFGLVLLINLELTSFAGTNETVVQKMTIQSPSAIRIPIRSMWVYFLYVALGLAVGVLGIMIIRNQFGGQFSFLVSNTLLYSAAIFGHFRFAHGIADWPSLEKGRIGRALAWGIFMVPVAYIAVAFLGGVWRQNFLGADDSLHLRPVVQFENATHYLDSVTALVVTMVDACIVAPVAEEILFRSGAYRILKGKMSGSWAAVISSIIFSLCHGSVAAFVPIFILGFLCCWIYDKTADIRAPIIMHAGYNFLVSLPLLIGGLR
jgi:membrane protease YdiL (CAAX protease family)